jgi:ABC-type Fe3+/spermidine/putrescine transport system ATPase subunit
MTFVFVTHDRSEALAMGDRIAVMNHARIEQIGPPGDVYRQPATPFVADFISEANLMTAHCLGYGDSGAKVRLACGAELTLAKEWWAGGRREGLVSFRPEKVAVTRSRPEGGFSARVVAVLFHGAMERLVLDAGGCRVVALIPGQDAAAGSAKEGDEMWCRIASEDLTVLPSDESIALP